MVVDDQQPVRVSLRLVLARAGYRVIEADSGPAAVLLAEKEAIEGAVIDIHMPMMNGFETCLRLQAQASVLGRTLRVWFMTGASSKDIERRATELGSFGVLLKPFDYPSLAALLEEGFSSALPPRNAGAMIGGTGNGWNAETTPPTGDDWQKFVGTSSS